MKHNLLILLLIFIFIVGCNVEKQEVIETDKIKTESVIKPAEVVLKMKLTSPSFVNKGPMLSENTCDDSDISPELNIENIPQSAKSLALIMDDPDAPVGTWDHWVVFNISPDTKKIAKGTEPQGTTGKNSWGRTGYGGPCPPSGTHRYYFKLYALDITLELKEGSDKKELEEAMQDHIIEQAELMGTYKRQ